MITFAILLVILDVRNKYLECKKKKKVCVLTSYELSVTNISTAFINLSVSVNFYIY